MKHRWTTIFWLRTRRRRERLLPLATNRKVKPPLCTNQNSTKQGTGMSLLSQSMSTGFARRRFHCSSLYRHWRCSWSSQVSFRSSNSLSMWSPSGQGTDLAAFSQWPAASQQPFSSSRAFSIGPIIWKGDNFWSTVYLELWLQILCMDCNMCRITSGRRSSWYFTAWWISSRLQVLRCCAISGNLSSNKLWLLWRRRRSCMRRRSEWRGLVHGTQCFGASCHKYLSIYCIKC